jgi:hypothetical protein
MAKGLGSVRSDSLIEGLVGLNLTAAVLIVNLPQAIVSFLYVFYNGLLTSMLLSAEFASFGSKRQPLRVTTPRGDHQRSTYWLQLPYAYAICLVAAMAVLHWLISQSIFLANIVWFLAKDVHIGAGASDITGCGYSAIAIIFSIILGSLMVVVLMLLGSRRFDNTVPLASSCSVAIAAACHPPPQDVNASLFHVRWGVPNQDRGQGAIESISLLHCWANKHDIACVNDGHGAQGVPASVEHCCLTSLDVKPPIPGNLYA